MKSFVRLPPFPRAGFTLVEVMIAATITLLLMGGVVTMFGYVTNKVTESRAVAEMSDQLRNAKQRLQLDLQGITAPTIPPLNPDSEQGYLEIMEGPVGPVFTMNNSTGGNTGAIDYQVGDDDDVIMFTARGINEQFVGRANPNPGSTSINLSTGVMRSPLAEIAWFLRSGILYRRVLLIRPQMGPGNYYYYTHDLSVRQEGGPYDTTVVPQGTYKSPSAQQSAFPVIKPNTLGDLTKRENRYGHQPLVFPYDMRFWNRPVSSASGTAAAARPGLGLPTIYESGSSVWPFPYYGPPVRNTSYSSYVKFIPEPAAIQNLPGPLQSDQHQVYVVPGGSGKNAAYDTVITGALPLFGGSYNGWGSSSFAYATSGTGYATTGTIPGFSYGRYDDVVMNHVLSFDIKVWDPGAPVFAVQTSSAGATGLPTAIIPGDPGYNGSTSYVSGGGALPRFINNPSPNNKTEQLSSLGAYVDLNYMYYNNCANNWPNALTRYARTLYGNNSVIVNSQSNQTYNYFLANNSVGIAGVAQLLPLPWFHLPPNPSSGIITITTNTSTNNYPGGYASIWDTWSTHYEHDGIDNDHDGLIDEGTDGIDNAANGLANSLNVKSIMVSPGIDDAAELEAPPPYRYPLRGLQIKIRAYESDTKQVREVTLVHEFLQE